MGINLNYKHLKQWNYLAVQKINTQNRKCWKRTKLWSSWSSFGRM